MLLSLVTGSEQFPRLLFPSRIYIYESQMGSSFKSLFFPFQKKHLKTQNRVSIRYQFWFFLFVKSRGELASRASCPSLIEYIRVALVSFDRFRIELVLKSKS